jgi:hypothetical protein
MKGLEFHRQAFINSSQQSLDLSLHLPFMISHTSHAVWTGFLSNLQLCGLYQSDKIWGLMDHEMQLVPMVHPFLRDFTSGHTDWGMLSVCYLCFPLFKCSFPVHSLNSLWQRISPKFTSDQPLVHHGQTCGETGFKISLKTHWGKKLAKCKSAWLFCISQHNTSMYEAKG